MNQISPSHYTGPEPKSLQQVNDIIRQLCTLYPNAKYDLNFTTSLEMLIATLLAAQCTDERVNAVTKNLFQKYQNAEDYVKVSQEELEQDIKPTGFYKNKAKHIRAACQYLIMHHGGEVPQTLTELVNIPGIGRKTANVILGNVFSISEGFIVDTHVSRLVRRLGWTTSEDPIKIEQEIMHLIPQQEWLDLAHRLIYHGRQICTARNPHCAQCTLAKMCPSAELFSH
jgi:endonuclease III